jgi:hypothetical protein
MRGMRKGGKYMKEMKEMNQEDKCRKGIKERKKRISYEIIPH